MVPSILNTVDPSTVSYLLNAIYFKANWNSKFDEKNTRNEDFTTPNGTVQMPMMHQDVLIDYMKNSTYSAIKMPYGSGVWNMVIMMPEEGKTVNDIIDHLMTFGIYPVANDDIDGNLNAGVFSPYEVDVKLPRYETSSDTDDLAGGLVGLMQKMGINRAFNAGLAEIPNMANTSVYISMMRQKAKIKVNEKGAEAAAVTVAGMREMAIVMPIEYQATFHANRPFIYVISEASTGVILFVGKFKGA
jgi:serpin B